MKIIFPKSTEKRQGRPGGRARELQLLLTNEPSNYKEWARGAAQRGPERAGGVGGAWGGMAEAKVVDHKKIKRKEE